MNGRTHASFSARVFQRAAVGLRLLTGLLDPALHGLDLRLQSWMDEYMPEEKPKVENAQVRTFGPYVIYTILSESDSKLAIDTASEMLTK